MLTENTVEILKSLSKTELKRFGDFIASPYFNSIENLNRIYNIVADTFPDFSGKKLEIVSMHKKLFPGKEIKTKAILNLYSEFGKILKKFIAYEHIGNSEKLIILSLAESLRDKKCFRISRKVIQDMKEELEKSDKFDSGYFYYNLKADDENYQNSYYLKKFNIDENFERMNSRTNSVLLHFLREYYRWAYQLSLAEKSQKSKHTKLNVNEYFEIVDEAKFLKYINSSDHKFAFLVKLSYLFYRYTKHSITEKEYFEIKKLFLDNIAKLGLTETNFYFGQLFEFIHLNLIPINTDYYKEAFELIKKWQGLKIYPNEEFPIMNVTQFRDMLTTAMVRKEFDWAEKFIREYIIYLDPELQENEMNYHLGILSFKRGKYNESLDYLNKIEYSEILEKLNGRFYYLMNYIELGLYDSALSMIKSIKQLHRESKEIPDRAAILIGDSLRFFSEIVRSSENKTKLDFYLFKEAKEIKRFYHKQYIMNKMEQLV